MLVLSALLAAAALATPPAVPPAADNADAAEGVVTGCLEELRKGELLLDADALEPLIARSFTLVQDGTRLAGSYAYLEPMRRLRERKGTVKELSFDDVLVRVFGASAVATYRYTKVWTDRGSRHREQGWSSDIFERRDDGAWLLIHRHRSR